mgnify:CR=1 FL=1
MIPPEFRDLDQVAIRALQATGASAAPFETEYVRSDGRRAPILVAGLGGVAGLAFASEPA